MNQRHTVSCLIAASANGSHDITAIDAATGEVVGTMKIQDDVEQAAL